LIQTWNFSDGSLLAELPRREGEVSSLIWFDSPFTKKPIVAGDWAHVVSMFPDVSVDTVSAPSFGTWSVFFLFSSSRIHLSC
jgi:hypothetical protein